MADESALKALVDELSGPTEDIPDGDGFDAAAVASLRGKLGK